MLKPNALQPMKPGGTAAQENRKKQRARPQIKKGISRGKIIGGTVAAVTAINVTLGSKLAMADAALKNGEK